jgi:phosphonate transport system substrate-binding protein
MSILKKGIIAVAVAAGLATSAYAETKEVNFGIISTEASNQLKTIWEPFLKDMETETGLKVNAFFASDYAGVIEGMRFGKVQLAWYGNKSAMEAVDRSGGEVFAQTVDSEGNPGYWSTLLVHKDSPIQNLDDVLKCDQSINFGLGDPNSTSGFLVPTTFIFAEKGIDPKQCFKRVTNASHETNALSVANQQVDVVTNNTESMRRLQENKPGEFAKVREIWRSPLIPSDPLVWKADLDQATKDKIYTFIMSYGRLGSPEKVAAQREVLANLDWAPFRPSSNAQLYPIRILEFSKNIAKLENDTEMKAEDKAAKIAELKAQRDEVAKLMAAAPQM